MLNSEDGLMFAILSAVQITSYVGDKLISSGVENFPLLVKCIIDSSVHLLIGSLTFIFVIGLKNLKTTEVVFTCVCGIFSSLIDIDHFMAARSLALEDATSLVTRPIFHCTTVFLVLGTFLLIVSRKKKSYNLYLLGWSVLTAVLTHHLRDGFRRGLWFCPFNLVLRYAYPVYICLLISLPLFFKAVHHSIAPKILGPETFKRTVIML